jgi:outer membrane lipoprotein SlyB
MKSVIKLLAALVLLGASSAFAQIHGTQSYCPRTGMWNYGPPCNGTVITETTVYNQRPVQVVPLSAAQNNGFNNCQIIGGIAGAAIGNEARNHRGAAVVLGAIAGGLISDRLFCTNSQGQQVVAVRQQQEVARVQRVQQQEEVEILVSQPAQVRRQITFEGGNFQCELIFNGSVVETAQVKDGPTCTAWTDAKAKQKGWVKN